MVRPGSGGPCAGNRRKILVVDDNATVLEWTRKVLSEAGYDVALRDHPIGAGAAIIREQPDLVLLDVNMPALDGGDLAAMVRNTSSIRDTTIVLHSTLPVRELAAIAHKSGANGFIQKTSNSNDFLRIIEGFLPDAGRPPQSPVVTAAPSTDVLILTDTPQITAAIRLMMTQFHDLRIHTVASDEQAAERIRSNTKYRFMAIALSERDGVEELDSLVAARENAGMPIIMISRGSSTEHVQRANRAGISHWLSRPVTAVALRAAVRDILACPEIFPDGSDKRRAARLRVHLDVLFEDHAPFEGTTWDISEGGAFVRTDAGREPGHTGRLHLTVPDRPDPVVLDCVVVHARARDVGLFPRGLAVSFEPATQSARAQLLEIFNLE